MTDIKKGFLLAILTSLLFALYGPATRGVYEAGGNIVFIVLFTTIWRALFLLLYCVRRQQPVSWHQYLGMLVIICVLAAFQILESRPAAKLG